MAPRMSSNCIDYDLIEVDNNNALDNDEHLENDDDEGDTLAEQIHNLYSQVLDMYFSLLRPVLANHVLFDVNPWFFFKAANSLMLPIENIISRMPHIMARDNPAEGHWSQHTHLFPFVGKLRSQIDMLIDALCLLFYLLSSSTPVLEHLSGPDFYCEKVEALNRMLSTIVLPCFPLVTLHPNTLFNLLHSALPFAAIHPLLVQQQRQQGPARFVYTFELNRMFNNLRQFLKNGQRYYRTFSHNTFTLVVLKLIRRFVTNRFERLGVRLFESHGFTRADHANAIGKIIFDLFQMVSIQECGHSPQDGARLMQCPLSTEYLEYILLTVFHLYEAIGKMIDNGNSDHSSSTTTFGQIKRVLDTIVLAWIIRTNGTLSNHMQLVEEEITAKKLNRKEVTLVKLIETHQKSCSERGPPLNPLVMLGHNLSVD